MTSSALAVTQYWSFVQSASSQAQLTATLAGISITAMVLVLSPLFLGPRMSSLGATRQSEIRDLFKFLLISFTTLITASMLWGQLNGYSEVEGMAWQSLSRPVPNADMAPVHLLFLACASLTTLGIIALSVVLLELVLLSCADPSSLTRLVLAMYAVIVGMASLQVVFAVALVVADARSRGISDQDALQYALWAVPLVLVAGALPAIRVLRRYWPRAVPLRFLESALTQTSALRRAETICLWMAGVVSVLAVQFAPEISQGDVEYGEFWAGDILGLLGALATLGYACLMWWALWGVTDRLSAAADAEPDIAAQPDGPDLAGSLSILPLLGQPSGAAARVDVLPTVSSARPRRPVLRSARKPARSLNRRHSHGRALHPTPPRD